MTPTIVWFRQDLRLQDNPALAAAVARGAPLLPVYILDEEGEGSWRMGGAARWWLHRSLAALDRSLRARGSRLTVLRGDSGTVLRGLARDLDAGAVYWNRRYEPAVTARDAAIKQALSAEGLDVRSFNGELLREPHAVLNQQGRPFQVFTPYWRRCLALPVAAPIALKAKAFPAPPENVPAGGDGAGPPAGLSLEVSLDSLGLLPKIPWDAGFSAHWEPGEEAASKRLKAFAHRALSGYREGRDLPARDGTSCLSPHLHFGEISPRQIWAEVEALSLKANASPQEGSAGTYLKEIGWREFSYQLLFHFPRTPEQPLHAGFAGFPWAKDPGDRKLRAWQRGLTGYPIVDAGMRQLWATGWMHNRVRMIAASFLVKHLRLPWQRGAAWFWDTLVDADLASNTMGWQWSAGCGADAAPYFRVFAPVTQGKRFDAEGEYVRRWVPELAKVPSKWIHAPWEAPREVLEAAGVTLGETYPAPIVDHARARAEALEAFRLLRAGNIAVDEG
jgi:deoxyribodipyrimidine photo-lyase